MIRKIVSILVGKPNQAVPHKITVKYVLRGTILNIHHKIIVNLSFNRPFIINSSFNGTLHIGPGNKNMVISNCKVKLGDRA